MQIYQHFWKLSLKYVLNFSSYFAQTDKCWQKQNFLGRGEEEVLQYPFYLLPCIWRDISHSREEQSDHLQPKGDEEKTESWDINDLFLRVREEKGGHIS